MNHKRNFSIAITILVSMLFVILSDAATPIYYSSTDFENVTLQPSGNTTVGKFVLQPSTAGNLQIVSQDSNKHLRLSRNNVAVDTDCLIEFYNGASLPPQYVVQYDAKLDPSIANGGIVYLLYGRKQTQTGGKFEYMLSLTGGNIHVGTTANQSTIIGTLSEINFTNIAIAVNDQTRTFSVYLDGILEAENIGFSNAGYTGIPSVSDTRLRISLNTSKYNAALDVDNLKVYEGSTIVPPTQSVGVGYRGVQESAVENNKYNMRLIATVDALTYDEIGFDITANYTDGEIGDVRDLSTECTYVYNKLTAKSENGIVEYAATDLGGNYLMALSINGIPADIGLITFTVTPYSVTDSVKTSGTSYTIKYTNGVFTSQVKN